MNLTKLKNEQAESLARYLKIPKQKTKRATRQALNKAGYYWFPGEKAWKRVTP